MNHVLKRKLLVFNLIAMFILFVLVYFLFKNVQESVSKNGAERVEKIQSLEDNISKINKNSEQIEKNPADTCKLLMQYDQQHIMSLANCSQEADLKSAEIAQHKLLEAREKQQKSLNELKTQTSFSELPTFNTLLLATLGVILSRFLSRLADLLWNNVFYVQKIFNFIKNLNQ